MAKTLDQLPSLPQPLQGTDVILLKTVVSGTPLDFKIDVNTFLQNYIETSEIGTEVNDIIRLVDDGAGNAGLPPISGALLTNINIPDADGDTRGTVFLSDSTSSGNDVATGYAATSKAVRDVKLASVQKTGDTMTGDLTFTNNDGVRATKFGGTVFNAFKVDASDNLEVGDITNTFTDINLRAGGSVKVRNAAGTEVFSFNVDGTINGVNANDIGFTPYSFVTATDCQAAIQQVADAALTGGGGDVNGPINFGNGVGVSTRNAADTANISTIYMDGSNNIQIGQTGVNYPVDIVLKNSGKVSFTDEAGSEIYSFNMNGTVTGLNSTSIGFSDASYSATNVNAALVEVFNEKLDKTGGAVTGDLVFTNTNGISINNSVGTPIEVMNVNGTNNLIFGAGATKFNDFDITMNDDFIIRNTSGTPIFTITQEGVSTGLKASDITSTVTGGISSTNVQAAIAELDSEKLNKNGGIVNNNLTFLNNTPLRMEKVDTSDIDVMKVDASDNLVFGSSTNRFGNFDIRMDGDFRVRNSAGSTLFQVTQAGAITGLSSTSISFTPTGNISATNVQSAISELDTEKLSTTGKAADSELLDGINSTSFARTDVTESFTNTLNFNGINNFNSTTYFDTSPRLLDNRDLVFGTSSDVLLGYDTATSNLILDLKGSVNNYLIQNNTSTILTLSRSTGNLTVTGNVTANSDRRIKDNLKVIDNALGKVSSLTGYTYDRIDMESDRQAGVIAQDVKEVLPEAVCEAPDGTLSVAYGNLTALLIEAIKDLKNELEEIKKGGV